MDKIFEFIVGEENHAKVSVIGRTTSTLYDCYIRAFHAVESIVNYRQDVDEYSVEDRRESSWSKQNASFDRSNRDNSGYLYNYANNLIMFSAPRGGGKTSAMLTFSKALRNLERNVHLDGNSSEKKRLEDVLAKLKNVPFTVLPPIDPTSIDDNHDIISTILARMLNYASTTWDIITQDLQARNIDNCIQLKNKLLDQITKCYQGVSSLRQSSHREDDWTLEKLSRLGDCASLKENLRQAVEYLLALTQGPQDRSGYLVIQIDDVDMNFKSIFLMLEYLQNYLMIPRMIILLAADLNFCNQIVYRKFYDDMYSTVMRKDVSDEVADMTEQYLLKVFPPLRRIYLPNLKDLLQTTNDMLQLRYVDRNERNADTSGDKPKNLLEPLNADPNKTCLEQTLLNYIYYRTGLVFLRHKEYHYILPKTQRGIAQLLSVLYQMEEVPHLADLLGTTIGNNGEILLKPSDLHKGVSPVVEQKNKYFFYDNHPQTRTNEFPYSQELHRWARNLDRFKSYFMNVWAQEKLSTEDESFIKQLDIDELVRKNQHVCAYFERLNSSEKIGTPETGGANLSVDKEITYADMLCRLKDNDKDACMRHLTFAIHTYYSIQSMVIVLNRLAECYEEMERLGKKETGDCSFDKLKTLYGSQLVHYPLDKDNEQKLSITPTVGNMFSVKLRWEIEHETKIWNRTTDLPKSIPLMITLLANQGKIEQGSDQKYELDFFAPLLNCLYMENSEDVIPSLKGKTSIMGYFSKDDFQAMQDTSLLIVLNWDLQHRFTEALYSNPLDLKEEDKPRYKDSMLYADILKKLTQTLFESLDNCFKRYPSYHQSALINWLQPLMGTVSGSASSHIESALVDAVNDYIFSGFLSLEANWRKERRKVCEDMLQLVQNTLDMLTADGTIMLDQCNNNIAELQKLTQVIGSQYGAAVKQNAKWDEIEKHLQELNKNQGKLIKAAKNMAKPDGLTKAMNALENAANALKNAINEYISTLGLESEDV